MDDLQNYNCSWAYQRTEVTMQPRKVNSKKEQAPARRERAHQPLDLWQNMAENGSHRTSGEESNYSLSRSLEAKFGIPCQCGIAGVPRHKGRSHTLANSFPWVANGSLWEKLGAGQQTGDCQFLLMQEWRGGWCLPGDEYKVSSTSSEVAKAKFFKAIAFCCWERGTPHSQGPDKIHGSHPQDMERSSVFSCSHWGTQDWWGTIIYFLNLFFIGVTLVYNIK